MPAQQKPDSVLYLPAPISTEQTWQPIKYLLSTVRGLLPILYYFLFSIIFSLFYPVSFKKIQHH